jgi:hypothetical protein
MSTRFTKRSRFNNVKVTVNGRKYDSRSEAEYAMTLVRMLELKQIKSIKEQVRYALPNMDGKLKMAYIADFVVIGNSGKEYIIDVKGMLTPEMKVKMAYFQTYHNKKVQLVFTTGPKAFDVSFLI